LVQNLEKQGFERFFHLLAEFQQHIQVNGDKVAETRVPKSLVG
jgi:hypothetical protein